MRRLILVAFICLLASLPILAQKKTKPTPPPPPPETPVTVTLPAQTELWEGVSPLFFGDGAGGTEADYTGGQTGITTTLTMTTTKEGVTSTTIQLDVLQTAGRKIGVQGLNYLEESGQYSSIVPQGMDYCRFSLWSDAVTLTEERDLQQPGCALAFLGSLTTGPHMHPPEPYDRFSIRVRIPIHLTSLTSGETRKGESTDSAALWFGDNYNPYGVCAVSTWSDAAGGVDNAQQQYVVTRGDGNTWTIAISKASHLINEAYAVITTDKRAGCRSYLPWSESSQAVRYWFTVSYY